MKKITVLLLIFVVSITAVFLWAGCEVKSVQEPTGQETTAVETTVEEVTTEVTTAGEVKSCRIWFWGEDEAVGLTAWMEENAKLYNEMYPNVTWEVKHIPIDSIFTGLEAAMAANDAPELHTVWGGLTTLQYAFADQIYPITDYMSQEAIESTREGARTGTVWNGKLWSLGYYLDPWYAMINKQIWTEAGIDPNSVPDNSEDFISALQKIKDAGYTPYVIGMKDGYWADFFSSTYAHQYYNDVSELRKAIIGEESLSKPPHSLWWEDIQRWRDAKMFNEDAMSLTLGEVMDVFAEGKSGYTNCVQPQAVYVAGILGVDNVGVLVPPVTSSAKLDGYCAIPSNPLIIPKACKYPEEAGKFLEFITSKERQEAMYQQTGAFPISTLIDKSIMKTEYDKTTYELVSNKSCWTYQENIPVPVLEAMYSICQELVAGNIDAVEAAKQFETAAANWRKQYPQDVENYMGIGK